MKYILILFLLFNFSVFPHCYAAEETNKLKIHEITRDIAEELTAVYKAKILDFFPVKENFPDFFAEVQKQIPQSAELLEVYLPNSSRQELERGHYNAIINMVYFYRMPQIMHKNIPLQKLQISFVRESLEAVYQSFEKIAPPSFNEKKAWEEKMYEYLLAGKNVYIQYKKERGRVDHKYSIMLTLALSDNHSVVSFLSHYPFLAEGQIYFLSSSMYLLDNNYYQALDWTRSVLNTFITLIPLDILTEYSGKE
jgi:hypothetical protein